MNGTSLSNTRGFSRVTSSTVNPGFHKKLQTVRIICGIVVFALLGIGVITSTRTRIFDEKYHLERADQIALGRPWVQVLSESSRSVIGPVFPVVYGTVESFFGRDVRLARAVTLSAAIILTLFVAATLKAAGQDPSYAVNIFCVSIFIAAAEMAMTEITALLFVVSAFFLAYVRPNSGLGRIGCLVGAAVLLALATLTRQTMIVLMPAVALAWSWRRDVNAAELAVLAAPSIAGLLFLLSLWGGLIPSGHQHLIGQHFFSFYHVIMALIYAAWIGFVMNPELFQDRKLLLLTITGIILNLCFGFLNQPVLSTLFSDHATVTEIFRRCFYGAGLGLGAGYFWHTGRAAISCRDSEYLASFVAIISVAISCGAISGRFSGRYTIAMVPFVVILSSRNVTKWGDILRLCFVFIGMTLGINTIGQYGMWG